MKLGRLLSALGLLLLVAGIACLELRKTQSSDPVYSDEARYNPMLAAGQLLERMGLRVRYEPEYVGLPKQAQTLVLGTPLYLLDEDEQRKLLQWVANGGHLVTEAMSVWEDEEEEDDDLLRKILGVHLYETEAPKKPGPDWVQIPGEGSLRAHFDPSYHLEPGRQAPVWRLSSPAGDHVERYRYDRGHITVLSDTSWLDNTFLQQLDHGAVFWRVIDGHRGDLVWIIYNDKRPPLLTLIWQAAAPALLAAGLWILVWVWSASRRFGPAHPLQVARYRRLSEHLEACGRYWRHASGLPLLYNASRHRLLAEVHRRHPQWRKLPAEELAREISRRAGLEGPAVARVLVEPAPVQLLQFATDIRLMNRLRKAL